MRNDPEIDRDKHDIDLLEHVFKGIRTEGSSFRGEPAVVDFDVQPWVAGTVISAVQVQVVENGDSEEADSAQRGRPHRRE